MKRGVFYETGDKNVRSTELGLTPDIAALAHELKTPLSLIRQLALFANQDYLSDAQKLESIERIAATSDRALRLVGDLTKLFSMRESELAIVETEPVNVVGLCEEVAHELWPLYKAHEKQIEVPMVRGSYIAVGHRELLRRVLLNYADNALKYSNDDSVVRFSVAKSGDQVRVGVRDSGPVLSRSDIDKAVKNASVTGRPLSSGLGLSIAEYFARCMQGGTGTIRHKDGMTFYVAVPLSEQLSLL